MKRKTTSKAEKAASFVAVVLALSCLSPSGASASTFAIHTTMDRIEPTFGRDDAFVARASVSGLDGIIEPIKRVEQSSLASFQRDDEGAVPLEWIRKHLSTKSPYPHDDRPVGILNDIPDDYELIQVQLVSDTQIVSANAIYILGCE